MMRNLFESVYNLDDETLIRRKHYGVIEVVSGKLVRVRFRPWPKMVSLAEAQWAAGWGKKKSQKDQVLLYYNQPFAHRNFLALKYIVSSFGTKWKSITVAMSVLDRIAQFKQTDAIVCELSNQRISERLMQRLGYVRHLEHLKQRHWIKRFYGEYPEKYSYERAGTSV